MLTGTLSHWTLVGLLLVIVSGVAGWVATGRYARTEVVVGRLVPDGVLTRIVPPKAGVIARLAVKEGAKVRAGQALATIVTAYGSADRPNPVADDLGAIDRQRGLIDRQMDLSAANHADEVAKLSATIVETRAELASLTQQIDLQVQLVRSVKDSFEPLTEVMLRGYVSRIQYEGKRQQYLAAQTQLAQLRAQRTQLEGRLRQAQIARAALPVQLASRRTDLLSQQATLLQKRIEAENGRSYVITAPVTGRVSALQAMQGMTVVSQTPLMSIVADDARLVADLYAPSRAIGFARLGQEVRLMYDAFPYQRFGSFAGRITSMSRTVMAPQEVDAPIQGQTKDPVYRIRVALVRQTISAFGQEVPLQPGMTLAANIVLDRRTFLDWLLEPIRAVRNRT